MSEDDGLCGQLDDKPKFWFCTTSDTQDGTLIPSDTATNGLPTHTWS